MTHFHPFPSISPRFGYPKSFGATLWSGLWKLAGSIGPMGSHGFPWVPMDHPREIAESPMNQIGKCGGFTGHRFLTPTQLGHDLEMRDTAIINHHFVGVSHNLSIFFIIIQTLTHRVFSSMLLHSASTYGGVLKWGYPKSPWISILKWILKRTNGLFWNNWGTYFRKAPYVRATRCPSSDKIFGTHSLFGVPGTFRCTPSVAVISFHFCTCICTFSVFPGPDRSKLTNFAANTALLVLIILYHNSHYIQFVVLVSSCFLIIDVWTDRVVKVRFKKQHQPLHMNVHIIGHQKRK